MRGALGIALALAALVGAGGCAGSFEEARAVGVAERHPAKPGAPAAPTPAAERSPDVVAYCRTVDDRRIRWGAWAKGLGALAGATGLGSVSDRAGVPASPGLELGLGIGAAFAAAGAVGAWFLSDAEAARWARDCAVP